MVKVKEHGDRFSTQDPSTKEWTEMVNIIFIEKGREGVNKTLSGSSKALDEVLGLGDDTTGLDNTRTHTQPVKVERLKDFPIGQEFPLHINREMWSLPQMAAQEDKAGRIIDGKLTYFKTELSKVPEDDKDYRTVSIANDSNMIGDLLQRASTSLRATNVRRIPATNTGISDQQMGQMSQQA